MINIRHKSLRELLDFSISQYAANKAFYFVNENEGGYTYREFGEAVYKIAGVLQKHGIKPGDKVALFSQNMPNWPVCFMATTGFGMTSVPMLPDFAADNIKNILVHSEAKALFVSRRLFSKIEKKNLENIDLIIRVEDFMILKDTASGIDVDHPKSIKDNDITPKNELFSPDKIKEEDLACIIYTSGTTGNSKGVMLTHKNLCAETYIANELRPTFQVDRWLSILPLSHTLELSLVMLLPMHSGSSVYYIRRAPTPSVLLNAFKVVHPTSLLSVPLVIEKIYKKIVVPTITKKKITRDLYKTTLGRKLLNRIAGRHLNIQLGGAMRFFGIGGAKLDPNVERFLKEGKVSYGIGYGLTECSPLVAGAIPSNTKLGSTGPAVPCVKIRLANKNENGIGEIETTGDNVTPGYYKNPEATKAAFTEDGWFKTNDLGYIDKTGRLYIKGRINNTIVGASGENIYPEDIEKVIDSHEFVEESLVILENGQLTALVHFDQEKFKDFIGINDEKLEDIKKEIQNFVNSRVNKGSRISTVSEAKSEFEKTATKKIKRYKYTKKQK